MEQFISHFQSHHPNDLQKIVEQQNDLQIADSINTCHFTHLYSKNNCKYHQFRNDGEVYVGFKNSLFIFEGFNFIINIKTVLIDVDVGHIDVQFVEDLLHK